MKTVMLIRGSFELKPEGEISKADGTLLSLNKIFNDMIRTLAEEHTARLDLTTLYWAINFIKRWSEGKQPHNLDDWDKYWITNLREIGVSIGDIALILNRSKAAVHDFLNQP